MLKSDRKELNITAISALHNYFISSNNSDSMTDSAANVQETVDRM